jgi:diaminohydroxyphosphoribosylaminopyrimidine deaminase / 5-amino-6-(5-phosphoribosylamino)uracil reductase
MPETHDPARDRAFMRRALTLARRGWGRTAPNPMVGAVVVRDGVVVGEGWHRAYGEPHAEVEALRRAGERARGGTMYVTLEPCTHHGKTPPCTDALRAAGIARVVVAVRDPHPVAAGGAATLSAAGIDVRVGLEEVDAAELNAAFFHAVTRDDRPFVTLKLATSMDGAIADHTRRQAWLTGREAQRMVHHLRAGHDAVAVGIGTALADDPALTVRHVRAPRVAPTRVVFDRRLRLPPESALVRTARETPVVVVAEPTAAPEELEREAALGARGVRVVRAGAIGDALGLLRAIGVRSMLVEGGAGLAGALTASRQVDRLIILQAPLILGGGALGAFGEVPPTTAALAPRWRVVRRRALGPDLMTVYAPEA